MNPPPRAGRRILALAVRGLAIVAVFLAGRFCERWTNGRWYEVHDEQAFESPLGTVHVRHVTETKGLPVFDTGDSVVTLDGEAGPVRLYQSKRVFQEEYPWVDRVQTGGDQLQWADGVYRYTLRLERVGPATRPR